jgi:hypothetical protein
MAKLRREHVMIAREMIDRDASIRDVASTLGVDESTLRYRLSRSLDAPDGRRGRRRSPLAAAVPTPCLPSPTRSPAIEILSPWAVDRNLAAINQLARGCSLRDRPRSSAAHPARGLYPLR